MLNTAKEATLSEASGDMRKIHEARFEKATFSMG
jgi:hypothetical protein